jgi:hypothetical protein
MTDSEIFLLASDVVAVIVGDLSEGIYAKLGGSLSAGWVTAPKIAAWAESLSSVDIPPRHRIVISYELVRRLYRDAEHYHDFAAGALSEERFQAAFAHLEIKPLLPRSLARANSVKNMFIAALTWVLFHELGHSAQEHGYIRRCFGMTQPETHIEDCQSDGDEPLDGRAAVISQVTELAADVFATHLCLAELMRHFLEPEEVNDEDSKLEFRSNLHLAVCGIASALYLFNGQRCSEPEPIPLGSHPTPVRRLEVVLPNIFEKLDAGEVGERFHGLSRRQLVHLCTGGAYSAGFFWLWRAGAHGVPPHFMPKGLLQDPHRKTYWGALIGAWDEIESAVLRVRRFGDDMGMLSFTQEFRVEVFS